MARHNESVDSTFAVTLYSGRRVAGIPFGRLTIGDDKLEVRSWPRGRSVKQRVFVTDEVGIIDISFRMRVTRIRISDPAGQLANVSVEAAWRPNRILEALHRYGYAVDDHRGR